MRGVTQPAPGYPQPYPPLPPPMMRATTPPQRQRGGGLTTLFAGLLAVVAAGLAVGGSFWPVTTYRNELPGEGSANVFEHTIGWWTFTEEGTSNAGLEVGYISGLVLVLAAALLLAAAAFAFAAARARSGGVRTAARSLLAAGAGLLTGIMLMRLMSVIDTMGNYNARELAPGEALDFRADLGLYVPLGGVLAAIIAAVLGHVGQGPAGRVEPNTPRMGFPAPYGYPPMQVPSMAPVATAERQADVPAPGPSGGPGGPSGGPGGPAGPAGGPAGPADGSAGPADGSAGSATSAPATSDEDAAEDDAETTQVVSNADAGGTDQASSVSTALAGDSATPASGSPSVPAAPAPAAAPEAVAPPAPVQEPAPAGTPPASSDQPSAREEPAPLTDLPAAPPAPELTEDKKDEK